VSSRLTNLSGSVIPSQDVELALSRIVAEDLKNTVLTAIE
jgi:hypothetical protein